MTGVQTCALPIYQPVFYFSQRFLADAENGDTAYHFKVHTVAQVVAHIGVFIHIIYYITCRLVLLVCLSIIVSKNSSLCAFV